MTKVELDLIPGIDMYLLFEKGMTGDVSHISKRYSKANNKLRHMILKNQQNILPIWTKLIDMVMLWQNLLQQVNLTG